MEDLIVTNLTDEYLLRLSGGRFVENNKDFSLRSGSRTSEVVELQPETGGLYDPKIFGSLYDKLCNCGRLKNYGYCTSCGSPVLDPISRLTRYGVYNSPVYYSSKVRKAAIAELLKSEFKITYNFSMNPELFTKSQGGYDWEVIIDLAQFNIIIDEEKGEVLELTDTLTDYDKISLEGIKELISKYRPHREEELRGLMNKLIPINPIALRPVRVNKFNKSKKLEVSKVTIIYQTLIEIIENFREKLINVDSIYQDTLLKAALRTYIGNNIYELSEITKGSRSNFFRYSHAYRVLGSGRGVIVPDMSLKITEVGIPFHMAYEMYKSEFIAYISEVYSLDNKKEAINLYIGATPDILDLFHEFIEVKDKHVLLNRNPTLHKYNILCVKVKLTNDSVIHLPQLLCSLFGADFDGDEQNFFSIPNELKDYAVHHASPKNMTYYEKDHEFLYQFNHETLNGLIISTKVDISKPPIEYVSFDDILEDFNSAKIEVDTQLTFQGRQTSYGRIELEKIIECDLDELTGPCKHFTGKTVAELYAVLAKYPADEMVDKIQKIQEFVLEMIYLSGETSLKLSDIYSDDGGTFSEEVAKILSDDTLNADEKLLTVQEKHKSFIKDYMNNMSERLQLRISESSRMKMTSLVDMLFPQMIINGDKSVSISETAIVNGLSEHDMVAHALNNRKLLELKFKAVPTAGYLTRQLATLGQSLVLREGRDDNNLGLSVPKNRAEGRMDLNGELIPKSDSDELVWVRSILSSDLHYMTPDMISTFNSITYDTNGNDNKGISFMLSLTESTTQKGLSLKHGGFLRMVLEEDKFYAPFDCTVNIFEKYYELIDGSGRSFKFPRTKSMVFNKFDKYKEGDLICQLGKLNTFSYVLDSVIKTCNAIGRVTLDDVKNKIEYKRCITTHGGKVQYDFDARTITIGNETIPIKEDSIYYYWEGAEVEPYIKFSSGLEDVRGLASKLTYLSTYQVFRTQFRHLMPHIAEEIIETLYYLITDRDENSFQGVLRSNMQNKSMLPNIAYGYASKGISRAISGKSQIMNDSYSSSIINPFMIDLVQDVTDKTNKLK